MITIPTVITAIIVHWKDAPNWIFWTVVGFGIFAWICGKTFLRATHDYEQGVETNPNVLKAWSIIANIVIWIQSLFCISAIAYSFLFYAGPSRSKTFENSIYYSLQANQISASLPSLQADQKNNVKEKEQEMLALLKKSQELAKMLNDPFLYELHPTLPITFKNKFIKGQSLYIQGLEEGNSMKQLEGARLLTDWQDFWEKHGQSIISTIENR